MQQSNGYIIRFVIILCIIIGGLLAGASWVLGPSQQKSIELDTKAQILGAVRSFVEVGPGTDVLALYNKRITSIVVNYKGDEITEDEKGNPIEAEKVDILKNYKKNPEDRQYPVFRLVSESDPSKAEAIILPVHGNGLWDRIWGYVALDNEMKTIVGVSFDHKAETPGLGQRIATEQIQDRYVGKKIFDNNGKLVSVEMVKGEGNNVGDDPHRVDGMSGATLTAKGLNEMLKSYLQGYRNFIKKSTASSQQAMVVVEEKVEETSDETEN